MEEKIKEWNRYPTGGIGKGDYCPCCKRFNARLVSCGAVVMEKGKVLLVKRGIEPDKGYWVMPGGYLEWDETVEEAALRELREETGFEGKVVGLLGVRSDLGAGNDRQNVDLFFEVERTGGREKLSRETVELGWFDESSLPSKIAFGQRELIIKWLKEE